MMIVLDNANRVGQVRPLLPGAAGCIVLVTSRSRLSGLAARDGARRIEVNTLAERESIALLRATVVGHRPADDDARLGELARLCACLPLALRIAAERAAVRPLMSLADLIADLRDESSLWDALSAEDDDEADAVRTVFAWSYRALTPEAARTFCLLGLHPGPEFSLSAAAALTAAAVGPTRHILDELVGSHLLEQTRHDRYQFHDLLRAYAIDQVRHEEAPEERQSALKRVLNWYLSTAGAVAKAAAASQGDYVMPIVLAPHDGSVSPLTFSDHDSAVRWYEVERANLIAATRAAAEAGLDRLAWQIPAVLSQIHTDRDSPEIWLGAQQIALRAARQLGDGYGQAVTLDNLAIAHRQAQRLSEAANYHREALASFHEIGDQLGELRAGNGLGLVGLRQRRLEEALAYFEQSLAIAQHTENRTAAGFLLLNLAETWLELDHLDQADAVLQDVLATLRDLGQRLDEAQALVLLGRVRRLSGLMAEAQDLIDQALAITRQLENRAYGAFALLEKGYVELAEGSTDAALATFRHAALMFRSVGRPDREAMAWSGAGQALGQSARWQEAIAFHQRAAIAHRELGDSWQEAMALDHLAAASACVGRTAEAQDQRRRASDLLREYQDPRAVEIRRRIDVTLEAR
jgi:tetratricopeptide (TPR) repeat protein